MATIALAFPCLSAKVSSPRSLSGISEHAPGFCNSCAPCGRKYAGIAKTFYNGYHELSDNDFFDLADKDISDLNLADRINIYNKI